MKDHDCSCSCGAVAFDVVGHPLFRILCHCTICQHFNDAPFADVVVYDAASITDPEARTVSFETYKPPPNVQRGKCTKCGGAAIEKFVAPLFPKLTIVPASVHSSSVVLPDPVAHIFYKTRLADATDALPKHHGAVSSQVAFGRHLFRAKVSNP